MVKPAKDRMRDNLSEPLDPRLVIQSIRFELVINLAVMTHHRFSIKVESSVIAAANAKESSG